MKAWWTALSATAVILGAGIVATVGQEGQPAEAMTLTHGARYGNGYRFTLEAQPMRGLYPGAKRQIKVTVVNPYSFPLEVRQVSGRLVSSSHRNCPATSASLQIRDYDGRLPITVKPGGRKTLPGSLTVLMPRNATPKCSTTRFTIALTGTGNRAGR